MTNYKQLLAWPLLLCGVGVIIWTVSGFADRYELLGLSINKDPIVPVSNEHRSEVTYNVDRIVAAHLFGEPKKAKQQLGQAPKTKLKLILLGVLATDNDSYARALIQVQSKKMRAYSVGDVIEGTDAALHKVESQRVILDRKGRFESLVMLRKNVAMAAESAKQAIEVPAIPGVSPSQPASTTVPF